MKALKTHVFSVEIPNSFTIEKETAINFRAINSIKKSPIQNPSISVTLQPLTLYYEYNGATLESKFHKLNLDSRFKAKTYCTFQVVEDGRKNFIHLTKTDTTYKEAEIKVNTLFIMTPINKKYAIEMICDVLSDDWDANLLLFESVWKSLTFDPSIENCDKAVKVYGKNLAKRLVNNS